jgi:CRISPR/Cas system-associated exonuclease Cas4 (RecB family)
VQEVLLSISRANRFKKCPRSFYYKYVQRLEEQQQRAAALGTVFHEIMDFWAGYFKGGMKLKESMQKAYTDKIRGRCGSQKFTEKATTPYELTVEDRKQMKQWLKDYVHYLEANPLPKILGHEETFEFKIDGCSIRGAIDRIDSIDENTIKIIDYKVGSSRFVDNKQVVVYGKALIDQPSYRDKKIIGTYVFVNEGCSIKECEITSNEIEKVIEFLKETGKRIKNEEQWNPIVTPLCGWCSYKFQCAKDNNQTGALSVFE